MNREHPDMRARRLNSVACDLLNLADRLHTESAKVVAFHRTGDVASADVHRALRDDYDGMLQRRHHRAVLEFGRRAVDGALSAERQRRTRQRLAARGQAGAA